MKISNQEDFWSGVLFVSFGVLAVIVSRDYPMGAAIRMGPGYFPTYVGVCLIVLGVVISALSFRSVGEGIGRVPWRAVIMLSASFVAFAIGMETVGFIPSLAGLIVLSALAGRESRWLEIAIECVVLIAASWAVFIYGIELPFPLWGSY
jgi:hypothetical protein